jgi:hypothetical protein
MVCSEVTSGINPETDDQTSAGADWAWPLFERQIDILGRVAEVGLEMVLAVEREAKTADAAGVEALARAYARSARAVRMTLMLQTKLIKQLQATDAQAASSARCATLQAAVQREGLAQNRKAQIERVVVRIAEDGGKDDEAVERLVEEASERLDHDDIYGDVLSRPVSELIAMICKDLGLDPDWSRLAQEAWAREEAGIGGIGWPLAAAGAMGQRPESHDYEDPEETLVTFVPPS